MGRRIVFIPRAAAWVVIGAICGLLAVRVFLVDASPRTCGEAVEGPLCHLNYPYPLPWFVWPAGAFVGAVVATAVCWSLKRFLSRR